ncbi:MAG: rnpA [Flaviaesturariibacter sp.]|nr:rnpA [Flaviaesturariibacter sp.]
MAKRFGISRDEKLKSRRAIDALFAAKKRFSVYPLQVWYASRAGDAGVRIGVTCSKRHFRRAVDRNRVKRLLREAYRLQKHVLTDVLPEGREVHLFFVFLDKSLPTFILISEAMGACLQTLQKRIAHEPVA